MSQPATRMLLPVPLACATSSAAQVLRWQQQLGTIEAGKRADLLIIPADPLSNLESLRTPDVVIQSGAVLAVLPLFHMRLHQFFFKWREAATRTCFIEARVLR